MKQFTLLAIVSVLIGHGPFVQANSTPSILLVNQPGLVMINGYSNASVAFEVTDSRRGSGLDFGFIMGETFNSLASGSSRKEGLVFTSGITVDFALRSKGADKQFGTSDDQIFRLSDPAHYASQYYSGAISPWVSSAPEQAGTYYQSLTMLWDIDHNGIRDLKITLQARNAYDGMRFAAAPTQVPLPAAVWLLVTGLAGLTALARRRGARPSD